MNNDPRHVPWQTHDLSIQQSRPHAALELIDREWLLTNGGGGYAAGTAPGCPTRRYHSLLVAACHPPVGRVVLLNQVWEQLLLRFEGNGAQQPIEFATLGFRGMNGHRIYSPTGHEQLSRFQRGLSVRWSYTWGRIGFERELILHWKQQAATLRYRITGLDDSGSRATLRLRPMVTLRDHHSLLRRAGSGPIRVEAKPDQLVLRRENCALTLAVRPLPSAKLADTADALRFVPNEHWWYSIHYPIDTERGQEDSEDYFVPGGLEIELEPAAEHEIALTAALGDEPVEPQLEPAARVEHLAPIRDRLGRVLRSSANAGVDESEGEAQDDTAAARLATALAIAADDFLVDRKLPDGGHQSLCTILAGYPWFADWGRDTFIALPGLLLSTGQHAEARSVLRVFARSIRHGLVPNRFDDYDQQGAHYNTVDGSLWFIHAALQYLQVSGDRQSWRQWLAQACIDIVEAYIAGTGNPEEAVAGSEFVVPADDGGASKPALIRMDDDGLITAGNLTTQLTWMDAAIGAPGSAERTVFTPRPGKAVEINALWYNALMGLAETLATDQRVPSAVDLAPRYRALAEQVQRSFEQLFWDEGLGHLLDHVWIDGSGRVHADRSVRPNQLFAVALPHAPLGRARQRQVVEVVKQKLLTPVGLRTLAVDDAHYHGQYRGDQRQRDEAYHQGTIWPWLIGPYAEAVLRAGEFSPEACTEARTAVAPLLEALLSGDRGALGQIHEIYEADPDAAGFRPVGCFAQAWSVAEVLRLHALLAEPQSVTA